jgi:hypothetical protein
MNGRGALPDRAAGVWMSIQVLIAPGRQHNAPIGRGPKCSAEGRVGNPETIGDTSITVGYTSIQDHRMRLPPPKSEAGQQSRRDGRL